MRGGTGELSNKLHSLSKNCAENLLIFALDFPLERRRVEYGVAASSRRASNNCPQQKMVERITRAKDVEASKAKCIFVVYETAAIREHAVHFCERLVQECECTPVSEMNWRSFHFLALPTEASDAAQRAADADVVVFAMKAGGDLPQDIKLWIENWLNRRGEREGAVVGLLAREDPHDIAPFREIYLRHIARRAGMDYLLHAAPTASKAIPDSLDSFSQRAGQVTSVLDGILHTYPHPTPIL